MTWDASTPQGSEAISLGDDRIRELKTDLAAGLTVEHSFPISTAAPGLIYTPSRGNTAARPTGTYLVTGRLYINTQTLNIERYNGASWDAVNTTPGAATVTETQLAASVAGSGLAGGAGAALSVNVDGTTIEINSDTLRIKDLGVSTAKIAAAAVDENKLAASVAGNGLTGGAGSALAVNVDGSTLEINSDSLRVKDAGITVAKLGADVLALMSPKSIQKVVATQSSSTMSGGGAVYSATVNVTISSVNTAKAYVIFGGVTMTGSSGGEDGGTIGCDVELTSATNVRFIFSYLPGAAAASMTLDFEAKATVVEWN